MTLAILSVASSKLKVTNYEQTISLIKDAGGWIDERKAVECFSNCGLNRDDVQKLLAKAEADVKKEMKE